MPTFHDPTTDAAEASEALRGLAHASRSIDRPEELYGVLGDLLGGVRSMRQVFDQLAAAHLTHRPHALDDHGSHIAGAADALAAADELLQAGELIDIAEDHLDSASQAAGRITWQPEPATVEHEAPGQAAVGQQTPVRRWISVLFLQDQEAAAVLEVIDTEGAEAAIEHLSRWDHGTETTETAMENGHVYDQPPSGTVDRETDAGQYRMIHNPALGHVGLYRLHTIDPADQLPDEPKPAQPLPAAGLVTGAIPSGGPATSYPGTVRGGAAARGTAGAGAATGALTRSARSPRDGSWFAHPGATAGSSSRGLGL